MRKIIILIICVIPFLSQAQTDILVLQKRGMHMHTYTVGDPFVFRTVYGQWLEGTIDAMRHDTIFIAGQAFNYKEIDAVHRLGKGDLKGLGITSMIVGAGFMAIGAINGALRSDKAKDWYTTSGYIIGGTLVAGGFLLTQIKKKYYPLGKRYRLLYLQVNPRK